MKIKECEALIEHGDISIETKMEFYKALKRGYNKAQHMAITAYNLWEKDPKQYFDYALEMMDDALLMNEKEQYSWCEAQRIYLLIATLYEQKKDFQTAKKYLLLSNQYNPHHKPIVIFLIRNLLLEHDCHWSDELGAHLQEYERLHDVEEEFTIENRLVYYIAKFLMDQQKGNETKEIVAHIIELQKNSREKNTGGARSQAFYGCSELFLKFNPTTYLV